MLTRLSLMTLAMIGVAGVANARTIWEPPVQEPPVVDSASPPQHGPRNVAITDEYGFRYDAWGNRLSAAGHAIAPPRTLPGATVIQNGRHQS